VKTQNVTEQRLTGQWVGLGVVDTQCSPLSWTVSHAGHWVFEISGEISWQSQN